MPKQPAIPALRHAMERKVTRLEKFPDEADKVVPWAALIDLIRPHYGAPVWALAGDTDGVDGTEEIAGAVAHPDSLKRMEAAGLDPRADLARNNAHAVFEALDDQIVTGPTLTNVNDFRAFLIP